MKLIDGRALAETIKDGITAEIAVHPDKRPNLAIILVGERPDSELYVKIKLREATKVGIDAHLYRLDASTSQEELETTIEFLSNDEAIDGVLLQLPLTEHLNDDSAVQKISPAKDIDGFHPENLKHLNEVEKPTRLLPPVFLAVLNSLTSTAVDLIAKKAVIIAKPGVFGEKLAEFLKAHNIEAVIINPSDETLVEATSKADILISVAGVAGLIKKEHIKKDALIVDIGINQNEKGETVGDVLISEAEAAAFITPVPGGIGPQTVAFALKNTLDCFNKRKQIS